MSKIENYRSNVIDDLLSDISPEEMEKTEKRMLLASRIFDGIKSKGWKSKDFAESLGKSPSEISKWLSGTHKFNSETLFDIERVLEIDLFALSNKPKEQIVVFSALVQSSQENTLDITDESLLESEKSIKSDCMFWNTDVFNSAKMPNC